MKINQILAVFLAGALQMMPFLRAVVPVQAQAWAPSAWAIVLKLAAGAATLLTYDAVSGATSIVPTPYVLNGTNGIRVARQLGTTVQTAHSWSANTAPLGSASFPLCPGVTLSSGGLISGTPTQVGTNTATITAWEFANNSGRNMSVVYTFNIIAGASPPSITTAPTNRTAALGATVTFTVAASGGTPLRYQWQLGSSNILNATNTQLTLASVQLSDAGTYRIIVTNSVGKVTNSATLTVIAPPAIVTAPQDTIAMAGGTATLTATPGGGPASAQWLLNSSVIQNGPTLTLANLATNQSGTYSIVLSNIAGVASNAARLLVVPPANPNVAPRLATVVQPGGPPGVQFQTLPGYRYAVQFTRTVETNWTTLTNIPAAFVPGSVSIPQQDPATNGFYRVLMQN